VVYSLFSYAPTSSLSLGVLLVGFLRSFPSTCPSLRTNLLEQWHYRRPSSPLKNVFVFVESYDREIYYPRTPRKSDKEMGEEEARSKMKECLGDYLTSSTLHNPLDFKESFQGEEKLVKGVKKGCFLHRLKSQLKLIHYGWL